MAKKIDYFTFCLITSNNNNFALTVSVSEEMCVIIAVVTKIQYAHVKKPLL